MKIVIDSDIPYIKGVLEPYADVVYLRGRCITHVDVSDADVLIVRTRTCCDASLLPGSKVKLICTATIGYDHIDTAYCAANGIKVVTAAGSNARGVLQWVAAALAYCSEIQGWTPSEKTLGVVGVGHVGSLIAEYASGWGFRVLCCDPPRQKAEGPDSPAASFVPLSQIASECDIITFHTLLTSAGEDATYHLADKEFFDSIRRGALFLNSSRGEVAYTPALLNAASGKDITCCIDTWENEPNIDRRLLDTAVIATPHIAGYSAQGKANATSMMVQAVAREYGLPLTDWYPEESVPRILPRPISWDELCGTIKGRFDIAGQTRILKSSPDRFEELRNRYDYRQEYF